MTTNRHVFLRTGDETETLRSGFALARRLAAKQKVGVTFFCEQKKGFQGLVGAMIGQDLAKELFRNHEAANADGIVLALMTPPQFRDYDCDVLVAVYPHKKWIDRIDSMQHAKAIVFFAYRNEEAKEWADRWEAEIHGELA